MQDFKVKRNQQTPKDAKLDALQTGHVRFLKKNCFSTPKIKISIFFKNKCPKIIFYRYPKTGMYIIELRATSMCTKFQANTFIFGCAMAQKPSNDNDVTF